MDSNSENERQAENPISRRIDAALPSGADYAWLARATGLPVSTVQGFRKSGIAKVDAAIKVARTLQVNLTWLLTGEGEMLADVPPSSEPAVLKIPIYNVEVAAGAGRFNDTLPFSGEYWSMDRAWAEANLPIRGDLAAFYVAGSSQEPELGDGDIVVVDRSDNKLREGMFVVRVDDMLVVKHLQTGAGGKVQLISRNPMFDPVEIDLRAVQAAGSVGFAIIGRAVWASKIL